MIIAFVRGQALTLPPTHTVGGSRDYLEMQVNFQTSDWAGLSKWVHFIPEGGGEEWRLRLEDDKITKSRKLNLRAGKYQVYVHGTATDGMRITTDLQPFTVIATGIGPGDDPLGTAPDTPIEDLDRRVTRIEQQGVGPGPDGGQGGPSDAVRYGAPQDLSEEEKEQARKNIDAGSVADLSAQVQRAETAAKNAESSRESAASNAQTATSAAETATGAASAAAGSAQSASTDAGRAESAQSAANGSAITAASKSEQAAQSAQEASTAKQSAEGSAQTATTKAGEASQSAQTAKSEADRAKQTVNEALEQAKASGEFDGPPGKDGAPGATGPAGGPGPAGEDGGHYTPEVTQPDPDHLTFDFTASKPGMPPVDSVQIDLPKGTGGGGSGGVELSGYTKVMEIELSEPAAQTEFITESQFDKYSHFAIEISGKNMQALKGKNFKLMFFSNSYAFRQTIPFTIDGGNTLNCHATVHKLTSYTKSPNLIDFLLSYGSFFGNAEKETLSYHTICGDPRTIITRDELPAGVKIRVWVA